jgi:inosine/guanosine/xanthosine phosphorylase family protein
MHLAKPALESICAQLPDNFSPEVGLILGSGLGQLADQINPVAEISYRDIPGFPVSTVAGHAGTMVLGYLNHRPVVCMKGRVHLYEGAKMADLRLFILTLKGLGVRELVVTNAAGSLNTEIPLGSAVLIRDHINFTGKNILIGPNDDGLGPRFLPMEAAYCPQLRQRFKKAAQSLNQTIYEGVYIGVLGPSYETPAEIRAFKAMGADLVGMSTVQEVIMAHYLGIKVAALSMVSNYAAGLSDTQINHEEVLFYGKQAASILPQLIASAIA